MPTEATLSSSGAYTIFSFNGHCIRFRTSRHLEHYTSVKHWDAGYLVCSAKYDNAVEEEEEYIDLVPILENLRFDAQDFLAPIQSVRVSYE